jgi:hypothetical protein
MVAQNASRPLIQIHQRRHTPARTCPRCGLCLPPREGPGTTLHYARWLCAGCGAFIVWAKWPRFPDGSRMPRPVHLDPQEPRT